MKKYSEEEKRMWLEDWQESGRSAWSYAKANGLNAQTFANWTKTKSEKAAETKPVFVEVPERAITPVKSNQEILIEKGDVRIHIPLSAVCGELRTVMEGLGVVL